MSTKNALVKFIERSGTKLVKIDGQVRDFDEEELDKFLIDQDGEIVELDTDLGTTYVKNARQFEKPSIRSASAKLSRNKYTIFLDEDAFEENKDAILDGVKDEKIHLIEIKRKLPNPKSTFMRNKTLIQIDFFIVRFLDDSIESVRDFIADTFNYDERKAKALMVLEA
jgi:hypothetical protein